MRRTRSSPFFKFLFFLLLLHAENATESTEVPAVSPTAASISDEQKLIRKYARAYYDPSSAAERLAQCGQSIALIGDVDEDGAVDLALGIPRYGSSNDGAVAIIYQEQDGGWHDVGFISAADVGITTGKRARFGMAIAQVGLADGSGVVKLAVSSIGESAIESPYPEGAVHLLEVSYLTGNVKHHQSLSGADAGVTSSNPRVNFGQALAPVGDWDGDGEIDLLVGAPGMTEDDSAATDAESFGGCVYLLSGRLFAAHAGRVCGRDVYGAIGVGIDDTGGGGGGGGEQRLDSEFGAAIAWVTNRTVLVGDLR